MGSLHVGCGHTSTQSQLSSARVSTFTNLSYLTLAVRTQDDEPPALVLVVDSLQVLILLGESASGRQVHNEGNLALVLAELGALAVDVLDLHINARASVLKLGIAPVCVGDAMGVGWQSDLGHTHKPRTSAPPSPIHPSQGLTIVPHSRTSFLLWLW